MKDYLDKKLSDLKGDSDLEDLILKLNQMVVADMKDVSDTINDMSETQIIMCKITLSYLYKLFKDRHTELMGVK